MDPLAGVEFVRGDLREQEVFDRILAALPQREVGLVLADMAAGVLKGGAGALIKVFRGTGLQELAQDAPGGFRQGEARRAGGLAFFQS
jgi:23S rRNA (uridine2552-2'-O)-methyltransferase